MIITNEQYGEGCAVEEYQGTYSLVKMKRKTDGGEKTEWCFTQRWDENEGGSVPGKSLPWKITLGESPKAAAKVLRQLADEIDPSGGDDIAF